MTEIARLEQELGQALETFDWPAADTLCNEIVELIHQQGEGFPPASANRVLKALRGKRRFECLTLVTEALLRSGHADARVRRQYAQSLIDRNILFAPELVLHNNIHDLSTPAGELAEAHGLTGRIYKQLYVNLRTPGKSRQRFLERALGEYLSTYRLDPKENLWHGVNSVALLHRAQRDGLVLPIGGLPDPKALATEILATLQEKEAQMDSLPVWDIATALEALVALGRHEEAVDKALEYNLRPDADAFEISSTMRQLEEVWGLTHEESPGSELLPILRAANLKRQCGQCVFAAKNVPGELKRIENTKRNAPEPGKARAALQKRLGEDGTQTMEWYAKGLEQAKAVARVELLNGKGHGTGWLVNRSDFFAGDSKQKLLVTNSHVISPDNFPGALAPDEARANFEAAGQKFELGEVVWSSPPDEPGLDVTFVSFKGSEPDTEPLRIHSRGVKLQVPPQRVYIIGYPGSRGLEISLHDNALLGCNDRLLHYRAPTEPGSSGSPVFEDMDWRVVGLHHAGDRGLQRIDGQPGVYDANEGISILTIQQTTKKG
jgi:hypothetical protein